MYAPCSKGGSSPSHSAENPYARSSTPTFASLSRRSPNQSPDQSTDQSTDQSQDQSPDQTPHQSTDQSEAQAQARAQARALPLAKARRAWRSIAAFYLRTGSVRAANEGILNKTHRLVTNSQQVRGRSAAETGFPLAQAAFHNKENV